MKQIKISAMFTKTPKLIAGQQMPIVPIEVAPNIGNRSLPFSSQVYLKRNSLKIFFSSCSNLFLLHYINLIFSYKVVTSLFYSASPFPLIILLPPPPIRFLFSLFFLLSSPVLSCPLLSSHLLSSLNIFPLFSLLFPLFFFLLFSPSASFLFLLLSFLSINSFFPSYSHFFISSHPRRYGGYRVNDISPKGRKNERHPYRSF